MATLLSIGALAVALLAIGYAWKLNRELDTARGRLDRYNRAIFSTEESIRSLRAELESVRRELRIELLKRTGGEPVMALQLARQMKRENYNLVLQ